MTKLRFELKKVKLFQGMEGYGLNADLYINGVKCLFVIDEGDGGCMIYRNYALETKSDPMSDRINSLIDAMDEHIKTLPPEKSSSGKPYPVDRDSFINNLLIEQDVAKQKAKWEKKRQKLYETAIVIGKPDGTEIRYYNFKVPLSKIPKTKLQWYVAIANTERVMDEVILNADKLTALGIKLGATI